MEEAPVDAAGPRRQMRMSTSTGSSPTNARLWTTKGETAVRHRQPRLTDAHLWSRQTLRTEVSPRTGTGCKQAFERGTGRHGSQRHGSWMRRSGFACLWMHHSLWVHQSHTLCVCVQNVSVLKGGVEPPRPFGHTDLNRARLPIPPLELGRLRGDLQHIGRRRVFQVRRR